MLKRMTSLFTALCLFIVLVLSGCSSDADKTPRELANDIKKQMSFSQLKELSGGDLPAHFVFKDGDVAEFSVMISATGESADTIACFKMRDDNKSVIVEGIAKYLENRAASFKATLVNEYEKLEKHILVQVNDIIILVICSDYATISSYLDDLGAKEIA